MGSILNSARQTWERLTCREVLDFLDLYLDGSLPAARRPRFERHMRACVACRQYLRQYQETVRLERLAFDFPESDSDTPPELIGAILAACGKA
jgi:anti-sigma factor RsiW